MLRSMSAEFCSVCPSAGCLDGQGGHDHTDGETEGVGAGLRLSAHHTKQVLDSVAVVSTQSDSSRFLVRCTSSQGHDGTCCS